MTKLSPLEEKTLTAFKEKLQKHFGDQVISLRLFGSRAMGKGDEYSDLDVLVLVRQWDWKMKREIFDLAWECYWDHDIDISPLVLSEKEYEELKGLERNIAKDIEAYGMPL